MNENASQDPNLELVPLAEDGENFELNEMEMLELRSLLEASGIPVFVRGASQMPNLPYELLVPAGRLEEAVEVIREARESGSEAAEVAEAEGEAVAEEASGIGDVEA